MTLPVEEEEEETDSEAEEQARMMGYHQEEEEEDSGSGGRISRPRVTAVQRAQSEIQPDTSSSSSRPRDPVQRSMSETRR